MIDVERSFMALYRDYIRLCRELDMGSFSRRVGHSDLGLMLFVFRRLSTTAEISRKSELKIRNKS